MQTLHVNRALVGDVTPAFAFPQRQCTKEEFFFKFPAVKKTLSPHVKCTKEYFIFISLHNALFVNFCCKMEATVIEQM